MAGGLQMLTKSHSIAKSSAGEAQTLQWTIAALNSIEMVSVPWWFLKMTGGESEALTGWLAKRLDHIERVMREREWLAAGRFTVADLLMADVLRVSDVRSFGKRPASEAFVARMTDRPAFRKVHAEQIAQFESADRARSS